MWRVQGMSQHPENYMLLRESHVVVQHHSEVFDHWHANASNGDICDFFATTASTILSMPKYRPLFLSCRNNSPTTHAFLHALSTVLVHMHTSLRRQPPYSTARLIGLWLHYADNEAILSSLASLCCRVCYQAYRIHALDIALTELLFICYRRITAIHHTSHCLTRPQTFCHTYTSILKDT